MELDKIKSEFQVVVYGNLEQYNEVLSKGRCRIFYKYMNRNGSYITDEFAEKLISTLPYAPVKGIYDGFNDDYTDHGEERSEGRIYGIVPAEPHATWEKHIDEDGVEREYLCVDVLLFTGLYKEAFDIVGKAQSMEIYEPSIKGDWMTIEGRKAFVYTDGCFLGLQVLGEEVEPCFEGAAFFSLYKTLNELTEKIKTFEKKMNDSEDNEGGKTKMFNFRLSDDAKYSLIFDALNPNYTEEGQWAINYMIMDVYDNYVVAYNFDEKCHERVYYTKNEESESIELGEKKKCYIVDVTESEKQALNTIQALNGGSYELIDENMGLKSEFTAQLDEANEKISEFEQKIEEANASIATLESEKNDTNALYTAAEEKIASLSGQVSALEGFKLNVENNEKEQIISKYTSKLGEETLNEYREKIADFTANELSKELAFAYVNATPSIFNDQKEEQIIPTNPAPKSGIEQILDKYKNR